MPKPFKLPVHFIVFLCSVLVLVFPGNLVGQTAPVTSSPTAVSLAGQALQSLAGGTALTDVTIQASASYVAGSDEETGTATLVARGNAQGLITLNLSGGERQEIRNGIEGVRVGADGTAVAMATHNCFIDANWFFPALSLQALATDSTLVADLVGQQVYEGQQVYHLRLFHNIPGQQPGITSLIQSVSAADLYLDAVTLRPVVLDFNAHPDNDAMTNYPTEIRFGAYQSFNGVWAPTRIQEFRFNQLLLDLTVSSVTVNSGISANAFTLPVISAGGAQ